MAVTRDDVARAAGVSSAVVSYVLNNGPRPVSPDARQRVLAAIKELGYRRDGVARFLRVGRTQSLGVVLPDPALPYARVPQDFALITAEGTEQAQFSVPGLTSIAQPVERIAATALGVLLEASGAAALRRLSDVHFALVTRGSCGCPDPNCSFRGHTATRSWRTRPWCRACRRSQREGSRARPAARAPRTVMAAGAAEHGSG